MCIDTTYNKCCFICTNATLGNKGIVSTLRWDVDPMRSKFVMIKKKRPLSLCFVTNEDSFKCKGGADKMNFIHLLGSISGVPNRTPTPKTQPKPSQQHPPSLHHAPTFGGISLLRNRWAQSAFASSLESNRRFLIILAAGQGGCRIRFAGSNGSSNCCDQLPSVGQEPPRVAAMSEWAACEVQCAADSSSGLEGVAGPGKEEGEVGGIREHY